MVTIPAISPEFCHWLTGLIDGEGHFGIAANKQLTGIRYTPAFVLALRIDDGPLLREVQETLGIGRLTPQRPSMLRWAIQDTRGCCALVDLLDTYPLRSKKRNDYVLWREAVFIKRDRKRGDSWDRIAEIKQSMQLGRVLAVDLK